MSKRKLNPGKRGPVQGGLACFPDLFCDCISPSVYGIGDKRTGQLVYIGKSKNPLKRFRSYRQNCCHNISLKKWLALNKDNTFSVILYSGPDIESVEIELILKHKSLMNCVAGTDEAWRQQRHERKPWAAKIGLYCPSSTLLLWLRNRQPLRYRSIASKINKLRNAMPDKRRVVYETELAMDWIGKGPIEIRNKIALWLSYTREGMIKLLEQAA